MHKDLTVNKWVKLAALTIFALLPFVAFYLGIKYYEASTHVKAYQSVVQ